VLEYVMELPVGNHVVLITIYFLKLFFAYAIIASVI